MATRMMAMTMMMMMMTRLRTIHKLLILQAPSGSRKQTSRLPVHYDACSISVWWFANGLVYLGSVYECIRGPLFKVYEGVGGIYPTEVART